MGEDFDIAIVGGGLCGGLLALRLVQRYPERSLALFEKGPQLGGSHTWSFHSTDVPAQRDWLAPVISKSWSSYEVRFPEFTRTLQSGYHSIRSHDFHSYLITTLGRRVFLNTSSRAVSANSIILADGQRVTAKCIFDARGLQKTAAKCGWQKFVGLDIVTSNAHGLSRPILMDATVNQLEGLRFFYVLPWSRCELLVEDTRYSDHAAIAYEAFAKEIHAYCAAKGWLVEKIKRREMGAIALPLFGQTSFAEQTSAVAVSAALGLHHPTTGFALPSIVQLVDFILSQTFASSADLQAPVAAFAAKRWQNTAFFRRLNNMLFLAAAPAERRRVLAHFYRRDPTLIQRFYQGALTLQDCGRLLSGKPPLAVLPALRAFFSEVPDGP